jgi:hypothetical protein
MNPGRALYSSASVAFLKLTLRKVSLPSVFQFFVQATGILSSSVPLRLLGAFHAPTWSLQVESIDLWHSGLHSNNFVVSRRERRQWSAPSLILNGRRRSVRLDGTPEARLYRR